MDGRTDGRTEGQKDGQILFYRTLPATTRGPKIQQTTNIFCSLFFLGSFLMKLLQTSVSF